MRLLTMGLIWCLILLVNVKALATLSRKKKPNQPQWENGKGKYYCFQQCANAPDLHRPTDICVLGRALALITQRQWDTIRQSKSVLHICQETTPPSKPHIMDYFFSIVLFVFFIRRKNTRNFMVFTTHYQLYQSRKLGVNNLISRHKFIYLRKPTYTQKGS